MMMMMIKSLLLRLVCLVRFALFFHGCLGEQLPDLAGAVFDEGQELQRSHHHKPQLPQL